MIKNYMDGSEKELRRKDYPVRKKDFDWTDKDLRADPVYKEFPDDFPQTTITSVKWFLVSDASSNYGKLDKSSMVTSVSWGQITGTLSEQLDLNSKFGTYKVNDITAGTNVSIVKSNGNYTISASGGLTSVSWGDILGTLSNQTDLNTKFSNYYTRTETDGLFVSYRVKDIAAGSNVTVAYDASSKKYTISASEPDMSGFKVKDLVAGQNVQLLYDTATMKYSISSSGGVAAINWGSIHGSLSDQTDLMTKFSSYYTQNETKAQIDVQINSTLSMYKVKDLQAGNNVTLTYDETNKKYTVASSVPSDYLVKNIVGGTNVSVTSSNGTFTINSSGSTGGAVWGQITGTLSAQTDLSNKFGTYYTKTEADNRTAALIHDALSVYKVTDLRAGSNVTLSYDSTNKFYTISATGGGGGLTSVTHDTTLTGDGTSTSPLGVSNSVYKVKDLTQGANIVLNYDSSGNKYTIASTVPSEYTVKTLTAGSNVTVSNNAGNWTINSTGGGGGNAVWGQITGTITEQTDLMTKFSGYLPKHSGVDTQEHLVTTFHDDEDYLAGINVVNNGLGVWRGEVFAYGKNTGKRRTLSSAVYGSDHDMAPAFHDFSSDFVLKNDKINAYYSANKDLQITLQKSGNFHGVFFGMYDTYADTLALNPFQPDSVYGSSGIGIYDAPDSASVPTTQISMSFQSLLNATYSNSMLTAYPRHFDQDFFQIGFGNEKLALTAGSIASKFPDTPARKWGLISLFQDNMFWMSYDTNYGHSVITLPADRMFQNFADDQFYMDYVGGKIRSKPSKNFCEWYVKYICDWIMTLNIGGGSTTEMNYGYSSMVDKDDYQVVIECESPMYSFAVYKRLATQFNVVARNNGSSGVSSVARVKLYCYGKNWETPSYDQNSIENYKTETIVYKEKKDEKS